MFLNELSEDKLSLLEGRLRLAITIKVTLDEMANIRNTQLLSRSLINMKKLSYAVADKTFENISQPLYQMLLYYES